ncbi:MAG: DUF2812 domain-containing protein [Oscillospiraceae bacterium]|nr:DUF2812 domain-containing protein [Oscillospiraceae bacterium]
MAEQVTKIAVFTIADFKEEEVWLRERAREGLHLVRMVVPCFYIFEKGAPEDVIYRLDFPNNDEDRDYARMLTDFGWENCGRCMGWVYWRKPAAEAENEGESELFTDDAGRLDMVKKVVRTRMLPLLLIFFACVLPNLFRALDGELYGTGGFLLWFFGIMTALYLYLFIHCGGKLLRMQRELERKE